MFHTNDLPASRFFSSLVASVTQSGLFLSEKLRKFNILFNGTKTSKMCSLKNLLGHKTVSILQESFNTAAKIPRVTIIPPNGETMKTSLGVSLVSGGHFARDGIEPK